MSWARWHREDRREAYRRADGAVVLWDDRSPYPNPHNGKSKMWTAWEPDPSTQALRMRRNKSSAFTFPRRWKTAEAAMRAVDLEFPLVGHVHSLRYGGIAGPMSPAQKNSSLNGD